MAIIEHKTYFRQFRVSFSSSLPPRHCAACVQILNRYLSVLWLNETREHLIGLQFSYSRRAGDGRQTSFIFYWELQQAWQGSSLTLTGYTMALSYKLHHSGTKQGPHDSPVDSRATFYIRVFISQHLKSFLNAVKCNSHALRNLGNVSAKFSLEDSLIVAFLNPELVQLSEEIAKLFKSYL
uniref:Uncharacterized protein n=1 Tax=Timema cristinae TaxID=61476 RepID=A0A7R9H4Z9_TIMCR|nr:unnamed protein product [Timema cristinae]